MTLAVDVVWGDASAFLKAASHLQQRSQGQGTPAGNRQGDHMATIHLQLMIEMAQQPSAIGKICNSGTRRAIKKEANRDTLVGVETV
jgi:hypothetical protein